MTKRNDGGSAFPRDESKKERDGSCYPAAPGMSLRDWFAGKALVGIMVGYWSNPEMSGLGPNDFAACAYDQADAMLAAREATE